MADALTVRVDRKTRIRLGKRAKETAKSESAIVAEAIRATVDLSEWQIAEIKAGLKEADAGDYASDAAVAAAVRKWRGGPR